MFALQAPVYHWHWTDKIESEYGDGCPLWLALLTLDDFQFCFRYKANRSMSWCADFATYNKYPQYHGRGYMSGWTLSGTGLFPRVAAAMEHITRDFLIGTQCNKLYVSGAEQKRINFYRNVMPTWKIKGYTIRQAEENTIKFIKIIREHT